MSTSTKALKNTAINSQIIALSESSPNISGTIGNDRISGTVGNDIIAGNAGDDTIAGNAGDDIILGGRGADFLLGNKGSDMLFGGRENDTLYGGQGDDFLSGDAGDDFLSGDVGNDTLYGGEGSDTFAFGIGSAGNDVIGDFALNGTTTGDKIQFEGLGSNYDSYAEVMGAAQQTVDGVLFDFGGNRSLLVEGVTVADLTSDYFVF